MNSGELHISEHGYDALAEDGIFVRDVIEGIRDAAVVEEYTAFAKGPAVLVLKYDRDGHPIHAVWGIPKGHESPAVLVTAYCPDPKLMGQGFYGEKEMRKRKRVKYVHEGQYVAAVDVELIEDDTEWSPYLSPEDADKLDHVRVALRQDDLKTASGLARIFTLHPVAATQ